MAILTIQPDTGFFGSVAKMLCAPILMSIKALQRPAQDHARATGQRRQRLAFDAETRRTQIYTLQHMGAHYDREFKNYGTAVNKASADTGMAQAATGLERGDQAEFENGLGKTMRARLIRPNLTALLIILM
jgi:uncharacterized protein YigE (DUF2233 family)